MLVDLKLSVKRLNIDKIIIYLAAISVFINLYLNAAIAVLTVIYVLLHKGMRQRILAIPKSKWILASPIVLFLIPIYYSNWIGLWASGLVYSILVFSLFLRSAMTAKIYENALKLICIASIAAALYALIQKILQHSVRVTALFTNANYYAYAIELVIIIACYRLLAAQSRREKLLYILVLTVNTMALFATGCRTAWFSVIGGLAILFVMNKSYKGLVYLLCFSMLGIVLAVLFPNVVWRADEISYSNTVRTQIWNASIQAIGQHPLFGQGTLTFYMLSSKKYWHAHNLLIELILSLGIVGTGLLCVYFVDTFNRVVTGFHSVHGRLQSIAAMIMAFIVATLIHGMADVTVMFPQTGILFGLLLAGSSLLKKSPVLRLVRHNTQPQTQIVAKQEYGKVASNG